MLPPLHRRPATLAPAGRPASQRAVATWLAGCALWAVTVPASGQLAVERQAADELHGQALRQLAREVAAGGDQALADEILAWHIPRLTDRQYFFLPPAVTGQPPARQTPSPQQAWRDAFQGLRDLQAERLWQLLPPPARGPAPARAVPLLYEILRERPHDAAARRMLGLPSPSDAPQAMPPAPSVAPGRRPQRELGWAAGSYWRAHSQHFSIDTNAGAQAARQLLHTLEELHGVWQQLYADSWCSPDELQRALDGRRLPRPTRTRHRVIHFQDRTQYLDHLRQREPQIELSLGLYRDQDRVAYLYGTAEDSAATWRHEVTHQLFHETRSQRRPTAEARHFWVREGVALYMESLTPCGGYVTLGGFDAERLQYARYRLLAESFFVPLDELGSLDRAAWQRDPRLRRLYSQAAGWTHFLMDFQQGRYRDAFLAWVARLHAGEETPAAETLGPAPFGDLAGPYRSWLMVSDAQLEARFDGSAGRSACAEPGKLCLGRTDVSGQGLRRLAGLRQLTWLDLAFCPIRDDDLATLSAALPLVQLNLEGTQLTDQGIPHLARWSGLQELDLSGTQITDQALPALAGLKQLRVLWLTGTRISDDGLPALRDLPRLERLDVSHTSVSAQGWERFLQQTAAPLSRAAEKPPAASR